MEQTWTRSDGMDAAPISIVRDSGWFPMSAYFARSFLRRSARKIPYRSPPFWRGQLLALMCAAGGTGLRLLLQPVVHDHIPVVVFYPFVLIASVWGGTLSGLSTLVLSSAIADYLWLKPIGSFYLDPDSIITFTAFEIVCLFGIFMAAQFRAVLELHVEGEERATLLAHEIEHRTNNLFGMVRAISEQTARNATTVADHQARFDARIDALARAQQLVSERLGSPPDLRALLTQVLEPFGPDRFLIEGPNVSVPLYLGTSCALLLHELSTNATKYGSLSVPRGMVAIRWEAEQNRVRLEWRELNGPPVAAPVRRGFGSRLLKTAFPAECGDASIAFDPDGVRCTVQFALI